MTSVQVTPQIRSANQAKALCEEVLKAFNTWRFKREQPSDIELLKAMIVAQIESCAKIKFVMYWGKGLRNSIGEPERDCLKYLRSMMERIQSAYAPGATMQIVYTDTHANLNGHSADNIESYRQGLERAVLTHFEYFRLVRLSEVCRVANVKYQPTLDDLTSSEEGCELMASLEKCARRWYRGEGGFEVGAADYLKMNMIERLAIQTQFPESIFVTFNGSDFREIFPPDLPIFYMYSVKKGTSVKPWFMDVRETAEAGHAA
ncbi:MAG: hypothetical protein AAFV69_11570 [Pseudomonadota bacterium]